MGAELSIPTILSVAKICEYLNAVRIGMHIAFKGGDINQKQARLIYMERMAVQNRYNLNPSDPTLPGTSNYVFSILRYQSEGLNIFNNVSVALPVISGPNSESVNVGQTATFSITLVSGGPATYQWLLNNIPIPGATTATLPIINAQLSQSGGLYSVAVTNAAGTIQSTQATLTVTANILLSAYYSNTDPSTNINNQIDNFAYQFTVNVTHNQPIPIPIPQAAANNMWWVWRVAATEQVDNTWFNTPTNNGQIPDSVFQTPALFGGNIYYYLRNATSFDYTQNLILSKV
jgi:hypothetical protein